MPRWSAYIRKKLRAFCRLRRIYGTPAFFGGDFLDYCFRENMPERIARLREGLDPESLALLDLLLERIKQFPSFYGDARPVVPFYAETDLLRTPQEETVARNLDAVFRREAAAFRFPPEARPERTAFYFYHGLRAMPPEVAASIRGKDFIDGGAYIGDSALALLRFEPRRIHSFDLSAKNIALFRRVMEMNGIGEDRIRPLALGLAETRRTIAWSDTGGESTNELVAGTDRAELIPLDDYAREHQLQVGFIKFDLEGAEFDAATGMIETLRRDRPVLSLSIYHNPRQFFELKPWLASLDLGYRFLIRRFSAVIDIPILDTCLLAYPAELAPASFHS